MKICPVIPARYASHRLPGKPLLKIADKPLIQWVVEATRKFQEAHPDSVLAPIVATDDPRIAECVESFGGQVMMTSDQHLSGTDRICEVVENIPEAEIIVNVQGDEPLIQPAHIEAAVALVKDRSFDLGTLCTKIPSEESLNDLNVVKVLRDRNDRAIYFSRLPIPFGRVPSSRYAEYPSAVFHHIGLYVYRREALLKIHQTEASPAELCEGLEQLRAMELGLSIGVAQIEGRLIGVDTQEDLLAVQKLLVKP